jgi:hypothetical protein
MTIPTNPGSLSSPMVRTASTWAPGSRLVLTFVISWVGSSGLFAADDPTQIDRDKTGKAVQAILANHGGRVRTGIWVGGPAGDALHESESGETLPTASAIKTAILIELFARFEKSLDQPPPGLDAILRDNHPAIAHFNPQQRDEVRKGLAGVSVRRLGGIMMGSVSASNLVYNAAANVAIALLGGPAATTRSIGARDPAFAPIAVRRYMLADRKANGDNVATPASLAAVLQRLASRSVAGLAEMTVEEIRRAMLTKDDPLRGRLFIKDGDLASDPITCVRSGWSEKPGGGTIVFVVMLVLDEPGAGNRDEAHRELAATAARLTECLLDLIDARPGGSADIAKLPIPKGWRTEDTSYPPPWAKELPWKGDIQIRFPPGWFDARSPNFWSYPVLYRLEGDVLASREDLEKALRSYDAGLYAGKFDGSRIKIDIGEDRKTDKLGHPVVRRSITIDGYDPFATRRELKTHLEVFRWYCPDSKKTEVLILRSPREFNEDDAVWKKLVPFWEGLACHASRPG